MPISIDSIESYQQYFRGVFDRAEHHAEHVRGVALALAGAVILKSTGEITVRGYLGQPANVIWFLINDNRYAMNYDHDSGKIVLRGRTQSGETIAEFDNNSRYSDIIRTFNGL